MSADAAAGPRGPGPAPDWAALRVAAQEAARSARAPYSGLRVGAAALVDDGRTVVGCNVENASYGLTLCAECTLVGQLALSGGGTLVAVACRTDDGTPLAPCGRCRQLLHEHGTAQTLVELPGLGPVPMAQVLPGSFGAPDLPGAAAGPPAQEEPA